MSLVNNYSDYNYPVTLKWSDQHSDFLHLGDSLFMTRLKEAYLTGQFTDIALLFNDGDVIWAHKLVLALFSHNFRLNFSGPTSHVVHFTEEVCADAVRVVLAGLFYSDEGQIVGIVDSDSLSKIVAVLDVFAVDLNYTIEDTPSVSFQTLRLIDENVPPVVNPPENPDPNPRKNNVDKKPDLLTCCVHLNRLCKCDRCENYFTDRKEMAEHFCKPKMKSKTKKKRRTIIW